MTYASGWVAPLTFRPGDVAPHEHGLSQVLRLVVAGTEEHGGAREHQPARAGELRERVVAVLSDRAPFLPLR